MSEKEKENKENTSEDTSESQVVKDNVTLLIAERDHLIEVAKEKDALIESLTSQLAAATALIEEDTRAGLINKIAPRTTVPKEVLAVMPIDKLQEWDRILSNAKVPAFKSGTPIAKPKDDPKVKLDNMFEDFKKQTWGKNK